MSWRVAGPDHWWARLSRVVGRRLHPTGRFGLRLTLIGVAIVLVAVPFSYLLFEVLAGGPLAKLDTEIARWLNSRVYANEGLVRALELVSWFGKPLWLGIVVGLGGVYVFLRGRRRLAAFLAVTVIGGGLVDTLVKVAVDRPRPELDHPIATAFGKSFPSGHAMSSTVTYGALLLVYLPVVHRRLRVPAFVFTIGLVLVIGGARLLLGLHFLTDVLGGYVLGLAWLAATVAAFSIWRKEEGKPSVAVREGLEPEAAEDLRGHTVGVDDAPELVAAAARQEAHDVKKADKSPAEVDKVEANKKAAERRVDTSDTLDQRPSAPTPSSEGSTT